MYRFFRTAIRGTGHSYRRRSSQPACWRRAIEARAVIIYTTILTGHEIPASRRYAQGLAAWNLEATWGYYLATPIDATHFIAASHVAAASTLTFQGNTYTVTQQGDIAKDTPNSDLEIYSIVGGSFPTYATLYNSNAVDGSEVGKTLTVIGRGTNAAARCIVRSTMKRMAMGRSDGVQSWGQNVVTGFTDYSTELPKLAVLLQLRQQRHSQWAAIRGRFVGRRIHLHRTAMETGRNQLAVSGPFSYTGTGDLNPRTQDIARFNASIFDARGLYFWNYSTVLGATTITPTPIPDELRLIDLPRIGMDSKACAGRDRAGAWGVGAADFRSGGVGRFRPVPAAESRRNPADGRRESMGDSRSGPTKGRVKTGGRPTLHLRHGPRGFRSRPYVDGSPCTTRT